MVFPAVLSVVHTITTDVADMQPVGKGDKMFDSDKLKDIVRWVKNAHHKRMY